MPHSHRIAFQGAPGAYSNLACRSAFPKMEALPCDTFEDAFAAVRDGKAGLGMIPIDNSIAGRVADIHHLLPKSGLHIVGEHFERVEHCLLGPKGAKLEDVSEVHSHVHALGQCRVFLKQHKLKPVVHVDTAGAAKDVAEWNDPARAAISSSLAAEIYGLKILRKNIEDAAHNTTRFIVVSRREEWAPADNGPVITSLLFRVRSVPAALYKALGGFATNKVNISKLESYIIDGAFTVAQFFAEADAHPEDEGMKFALDELKYFSTEWRILGVYPAHPFRRAKR